MQLVINGQQVEVENGIKNIEDLLHHFQLQERIVVIEQNGEIVEKAHNMTFNPSMTVTELKLFNLLEEDEKHVKNWR